MYLVTWKHKFSLLYSPSRSQALVDTQFLCTFSLITTCNFNLQGFFIQTISSHWPGVVWSPTILWLNASTALDYDFLLCQSLNAHRSIPRVTENCNGKLNRNETKPPEHVVRSSNKCHFQESPLCPFGEGPKRTESDRKLLCIFWKLNYHLINAPHLNGNKIRKNVCQTRRTAERQSNNLRRYNETPWRSWGVAPKRTLKQTNTALCYVMCDFSRAHISVECEIRQRFDSKTIDRLSRIEWLNETIERQKCILGFQQLRFLAVWFVKLHLFSEHKHIRIQNVTKCINRYNFHGTREL